MIQKQRAVVSESELGACCHSSFLSASTGACTQPDIKGTSSSLGHSDGRASIDSFRGYYHMFP